MPNPNLTIRNCFIAVRRSRVAELNEARSGAEPVVTGEARVYTQLVNNAGGKNAVRRAFRIFDPAGTGLITYSQFRAALHKLNISPTDESMRAILREFDADRDGVIDHADFVAALTLDNREYQWDEERLAPDQLRPGLQVRAVERGIGGRRETAERSPTRNPLRCDSPLFHRCTTQGGWSPLCAAVWQCSARSIGTRGGSLRWC